MTPALGGLITQVCIDLKCTEISTINMLGKCKRYEAPRDHIRRGGRFMCPSQPTVTEVKKDKVRAGQQKTKRQHG